MRNVDRSFGYPIGGAPRRSSVGSGSGAIIAAVTLLVTFSVIIGLQMRSGLGWALDVIIATVIGGIAVCVGAGVTMGVIALLRRLPLVPTGLLIGVLIALAVVIPLSSALTFMTMILSTVLAMPLLISAALIGGAIGYGLKAGFRRLTAILWIVLAMVVGVASLFWLVNPGQAGPTISSVHTPHVKTTLTDVPNPGLAGPFQVNRFVYGSGSDHRRPEYGAAVDVRTPAVDASSLIYGWDGLQGRLRTWYWGFGPDRLPLNGRVWYPNGEGPFPLVLIVHGNHRMFDYSDPGYAYLGEHLASRGFIVVSVDQNFLNGSLYGELGGENSVRGWLLLQHLALWRTWNETPDHIMAGQVDMDRIALVGHSRGGEAVVLAHAYNSVPHYPGDANLDLDFGFNIRSLVAIAPTDGQFEPADRPVPVENVNYLLLTGLHDADVADLSGGRTYDRVELAEGSGQFKAAVHVYGANHGQFNTEWGHKDLPLPFHWTLNQRPLIPGEAQRQITAVYLTAFLEATLRDEAGYVPMFRDHRFAAGWLPETLYYTAYQDTTHHTVARFDEDIDLTTTTVPGGVITGHHLSAWSEGWLPTPYNQGTRFGAYVAWEDSTAGEPPRLTISLPEGLATQWGIDERSLLVLSLAAAYGEDPVDFTVRLVYDNGYETALPLSTFGTLWRVPEVKRFKLGSLENMLTGGNPILMHRIELPIAAFVDQARVSEHELRSIELVFDRTPEGALYIDEVAFAEIRSGRQEADASLDDEEERWLPDDENLDSPEGSEGNNQGDPSQGPA